MIVDSFRLSDMIKFISISFIIGVYGYIWCLFIDETRSVYMRTRYKLWAGLHIIIAIIAVIWAWTY